MARPKLPEGEARSERIYSRVTPDELEEITQAAAEEGVSDWARDELLKAARRKNRKAKR